LIASRFLTLSPSGMPLTEMLPRWCCSSRLMHRMRIDFPKPEGPQTTMRSPVATVRLMHFRTWKLPYAVASVERVAQCGQRRCDVKHGHRASTNATCALYQFMNSETATLIVRKMPSSSPMLSIAWPVWLMTVPTTRPSSGYHHQRIRSLCLSDNSFGEGVPLALLSAQGRLRRELVLQICTLRTARLRASIFAAWVLTAGTVREQRRRNGKE
jgi:hypothetical protein